VHLLWGFEPTRREQRTCHSVPGQRLGRALLLHTPHLLDSRSLCPCPCFHEVRFPDNIAYGATGGPEFATTVVVTGAGHEQRNVNWAEARGRWDVASGLKKQAQIDELIAFFRARRGKAYGFRFKGLQGHRPGARHG
jgi:Conserved hypothetical protein 2217 (DUF2460)